jgi:hypothetical protein
MEVADKMVCAYPEVGQIDFGVGGEFTRYILTQHKDCPKSLMSMADDMKRTVATAITEAVAAERERGLTDSEWKVLENIVVRERDAPIHSMIHNEYDILRKLCEHHRAAGEKVSS